MENEDVLRPRSRKNIQCPKCEGKGKVDKYYPVRNRRNPLLTERIPVKEICSTCKGHGFVRVS